MRTAVEPNFLQWDQVICLLQIPDEDLQWLVDTQQLLEIPNQDHQLFDSRDVDRLIDSYRKTAQRRAI